MKDCLFPALEATSASIGLSSRASKLSIASLLALATLALSVFVDSENRAHAGLCAVGQVKEVGTWINPDTNTRGITKAVFTEECQNAPRTICRGDICRTTSGVKLVYKARLWGQCHPTDCYWGQVEGVYTSANWLHFKYNQGFARRTVLAQVYSRNNDWLRLIVNTDFVSASRRDYRFDAWFRRAL
jgi:hypothetical protein